MAAFLSSPKPTFLVLFYCVLFFSSATAASNSSDHSTSTSTSPLATHQGQAFANSICKSTPYPDTCLNTSQLSITISIDPNILSYLLHTLQAAVTEIRTLTHLFSIARSSSDIVEKQKGALQDCQDLNQITLSSLQKSVNRIKREADVKVYLSAALTNKETCLEGLDSATGSFKQTLVSSVVSTYKYVSNSLALLSKTSPPHKYGGHGRRLMGFPKWISRKDRRILQTSPDDYHEPNSMLTVAQDGSGNFTTISDAIGFAPNNSADRVIIYVKEGIYEEYVDIPSYKTNILLLGDGNDVTIVTGNRSFQDGWTTFHSATVAVSGEGFLARDIWFENSAGPEKGQAVAVRVNADLVAFYRCSFTGFQDTLYVHSFRQFYRECDIYGTVDFIFGNAAVVFQGCTIVARNPLPGQSNVITAQSRTDDMEPTGISIQNCSILGTQDLDTMVTKSYLGRPWRNYSRTVYMESYMGELIDPAGWLNWSGTSGLETLYYGEYENNGPGSVTDNRVTWPGYHVMSYEEASNFTVSEFILGDEWLGATNIPYEDGI